VRISLDYYRVLGIPLHTPVEQIALAYQDKLVQMPHPNFSEAAIISRRELLDQAQAILGDPEQHQAYEAQWWGHTDSELPEELVLDSEEEPSEPSEPAVAQEPYLELTESQIKGALLLLLEVGDYGQSLQVAEIALQGEPEQEDFLLALALAYLELSRDQWHNQEYETAATSLLKALGRLQTFNQFAQIQSQLREELYKLRPYRIFELLAKPRPEGDDRHLALELLRAMIQDRGGIEGKGNDHSGLNADDFYQFIEYLRSHLTLTEQEDLFLAEAARPSAKATYLGWQTQIAKAVALHQPSSLQLAQQLLDSLSSRQDVSLERAICALLLGQMEEALVGVKNLKDPEVLSLIQENSRNEPDLLPGLYIYAGIWLRRELEPHFQDLSPSSFSLEEYFNNTEVQDFIENQTLTPPLPAPAPLESAPPSSMSLPLPDYSEAPLPPNPPRRRRSSRSRSSLLELSKTANTNQSQLPGRTLSTNSLQADTLNWGEEETLAPEEGNRVSSPQLPAKRRQRRKKAIKTTINPLRFGLFIATLVALAAGIIAWVLYGRSPNLPLNSNPLALELAAPPLEIPDAAQTNQLLLSEPQLGPEVAQNIVEIWLAQKSAAFGPEHNLDGLAQILAPTILPEWQKLAAQERKLNRYRKYQHQVKALDQQVLPNSPQKGTLIAQVQETTFYFQANQPQKAQRQTTENLTVIYGVKYENGQWKISAIAAQ
jgi:hypothetical protein